MRHFTTSRLYKFSILVLSLTKTHLWYQNKYLFLLLAFWEIQWVSILILQPEILHLSVSFKERTRTSGTMEIELFPFLQCEKYTVKAQCRTFTELLQRDQTNRSSHCSNQWMVLKSSWATCCLEIKTYGN